MDKTPSKKGDIERETRLRILQMMLPMYGASIPKVLFPKALFEITRYAMTGDIKKIHEELGM